MKNADKPIHPASVAKNNVNLGKFEGLTKREYFATLAMQGLIANAVLIHNQALDALDCAWVSEKSVQVADRLLTELEKPQP